MEVIYERDLNVGNGYQAYRGRLQGANEVHEFDGVHFEALLRLLNDKLPGEDNTITFIRSDRPELQPYPLKDELVFLIKSNVEEAIQRMSHPDVRVVIGRNPQTPTVLKSCDDTLAGAFGEDVLVRRRHYSVECPTCGKWALVVGGAAHTWAIEGCGCGLKYLLCKEMPDPAWFSVKVESLLAQSAADRFFLPREWNNYKPWISRKELEDKLDAFRLIKETYDDE